MLVDAFTMLTQLDVYRLAGMFWYALVMEIPRFTLGLVVVSGCFLVRPRHPAAVIPRNTRISVLFPGHNEGSALRQAVTALGEQTRSDLQIVVVADGSTDDMAEIGRQFKEEALFTMFVPPALPPATISPL